MEKINKLYDYLLDYGVNKQTLDAITGINGYNEKTLNDVLYYFTGYRDFEQLEELEEL